MRPAFAREISVATVVAAIAALSYACGADEPLAPRPGAGSSSGGAGSSGGSSGGASSGGTSSGGASSSGTPGGDAGAGTTLTNVYITSYGFNDNSCQTESQHGCDMIAFPKSAGFPTRHEVATEGTGAYDDPITFATAADDTGANAELAPGTIVYVPELRKYFVMEDTCFECGNEWTAQHAWHIDLWMGPGVLSDAASLAACEEKVTVGVPYGGTGTIIVDPPPTLPVDTGPLFANDQCLAHVYPP